MTDAEACELLNMMCADFDEVKERPTFPQRWSSEAFKQQRAEARRFWGHDNDVPEIHPHDQTDR
jgi:hypothetical protein